MGTWKFAASPERHATTTSRFELLADREPKPLGARAARRLAEREERRRTRRG